MITPINMFNVSKTNNSFKSTQKTQQQKVTFPNSYDTFTFTGKKIKKPDNVFHLSIIKTLPILKKGKELYKEVSEVAARLNKTSGPVVDENGVFWEIVNKEEYIQKAEGKKDGNVVYEMHFATDNHQMEDFDKKNMVHDIQVFSQFDGSGQASFEESYSYDEPGKVEEYALELEDIETDSTYSETIYFDEKKHVCGYECNYVSYDDFE